MLFILYCIVDAFTGVSGAISAVSLYSIAIAYGAGREYLFSPFG